MNLYTEAGGLFGTHVTWSDIEGDMQRELNTTASFGPNKSATDIGEDSLHICMSIRPRIGRLVSFRSRVAIVTVMKFQHWSWQGSVEI
ncbi:hypothetical protein V3C99_001048 [Haemonchus contortus]|uniref:Uncharacterized protein n=1 Tax=Haemonchus contortus TaxID=6289 RepID=A0A7I5E9D8_HAECO